MTKTDLTMGLGGWVIAIVVVIFWLNSTREKNQLITGYQDALQEKDDTIRYHKSENGKIVASKLAAEITAKQAMEAYREDLDKIRETFRIEAKNIRSYVKAEFAARGTGTTVIRDTVFMDSTGAQISERTFVVKDGYLSMAGRFRENSDLFYDYSYRDSLQIVSHFKKQGLFKRTRLFVDAAFQNPNNKITGLRNIQVSDFKDKRFGVGPYIGWDVVNWRVAAGVSIHYSLIRF